MIRESHRFRVNAMGSLAGGALGVGAVAGFATIVSGGAALVPFLALGGVAGAVIGSNAANMIDDIPKYLKIGAAVAGAVVAGVLTGGLGGAAIGFIAGGLAANVIEKVGENFNIGLAKTAAILTATALTVAGAAVGIGLAATFAPALATTAGISTANALLATGATGAIMGGATGLVAGKIINATASAVTNIFTGTKQAQPKVPAQVRENVDIKVHKQQQTEQTLDSLSAEYHKARQARQDARTNPTPPAQEQAVTNNNQPPTPSTTSQKRTDWRVTIDRETGQAKSQIRD